MFTQDGEGRGESFVPQGIVFGEGEHVRRGSRTPENLGVDVEQALLGHQVHVVT